MEDKEVYTSNKNNNLSIPITKNEKKNQNDQIKLDQTHKILPKL